MTTLNEILNEVKSMNLPQNVKTALLGAIDSAITQINVKPKTEQISYEEIREVVPKYIQCEFYDEQYVVFDKNSMLKLLQATQSNLMKYKKEIFDCDDFAKFVDAYMTAYHGCNSTGQCFVALYQMFGFVPKFVGLHMCNLPVVINDDGDLDVIIYEPQLGKYIESGCIDGLCYAPFKVMYY